MMMNLFSVFDPVTFLGISMNWLSLMLIILLIPTSFYIYQVKMKILFLYITKMMENTFSEVSYPKNLGLVILSLMLFVYIGLMNGVGLFPFVFTSTSHLMITCSLGFLMWLSSFLMGWLKNFSESSSHLVPEGSPVILAPFMVMIESISHLIRPVTLSVRLAANMMAGHLIIGLIAMISLNSFSGFFVSVILQIFMLILEIAVAIIQAFVFSVLVLLYCLDYY